MKMRPSYIIFLCLLTAAPCLLSTSVVSSSNSPVPVSLLGRRTMRDLSMSSSTQQDAHHAHHKIKVHEEMERYSNQPGSFSNEFASVYNEPELVYHIDYHGVTTHPNGPNPSPTHPKP